MFILILLVNCDLAANVLTLERCFNSVGHRGFSNQFLPSLDRVDKLHGQHAQLEHQSNPFGREKVVVELIREEDELSDGSVTLLEHNFDLCLGLVILFHHTSILIDSSEDVLLRLF